MRSEFGLFHRQRLIATRSLVHVTVHKKRSLVLRQFQCGRILLVVRNLDSPTSLVSLEMEASEMPLFEKTP